MGYVASMKRIAKRCLPGSVVNAYSKTKRKASGAKKRLMKVKGRVSQKLRYGMHVPRRPMISVVIPTYQPNPYIDDAIASVLRQHCKSIGEIEALICVNGDNAQYADSLTEQYEGHPNVRILHTPIKGASSARNLGVREAQGHYITFLDDDDLFSDGFLEDLVGLMRRGVDVACGRMLDFNDETGDIEGNTYINRVIEVAGADEYATQDFLRYASLFSTVCSKLYRREFLLACKPMDETLLHTEDVVFWAENVGGMAQGFAATGMTKSSEEGYLRRVTQSSRSRPNDKSAFSFYVDGRLEVIKNLESLIEHQADTKQRRFVLGKIKAQTNIMRDYFATLDDERKANAREKIFNTDSLFLNKSLFGEKQGLAFCHNFSPYVDASAYAATKRLHQLNQLVGDEVYWRIISAPMPSRKVDATFDLLYAQFQYAEKEVIGEITYFSEESQRKWGNEAFEAVKDERADVIYSRSMWVGSHVAALLYKSAHPEAIWYAEFSDPIYMGSNNEPRPSSGAFVDGKEHLDHFWRDIERDVMEQADFVIFTNENQRTYMLKMNPSLTAPQSIIDKSLILSHPALGPEYADLVHKDYDLDPNKINIGYFGSFYANRNSADLLKLLDNKDVQLHLFVSGDMSPSLNGIDASRISINPPVDHLAFLNMAAKMDYLFLNDISFDYEINPYLPSKLADYLASGTKILAKIQPGSPMSKIESNQLIKIDEITDTLLGALTKKEAQIPTASTM